MSASGFCTNTLVCGRLSVVGYKAVMSDPNRRSVFVARGLKELR